MNYDWLKSEAAATLFAVVIGAILTMITTTVAERASEKNRKTEQIREHQIDSLKELVHLMQSNDYIIKNILSSWEYSLQKISATASVAQIKNIISNQLSDISLKVTIITENQEKVSQEFWELQFLKYETEQISIISSYAKAVDTIIVFLKDNLELENENSLRDYKNMKKATEELFSEFVQEAKNGLL